MGWTIRTQIELTCATELPRPGDERQLAPAGPRVRSRPTASARSGPPGSSRPEGGKRLAIAAVHYCMIDGFGA